VGVRVPKVGYRLYR